MRQYYMYLVLKSYLQALAAMVFLVWFKTSLPISVYAGFFVLLGFMIIAMACLSRALDREFQLSQARQDEMDDS